MEFGPIIYRDEIGDYTYYGNDSGESCHCGKFFKSFTVYFYKDGRYDHEATINFCTNCYLEDMPSGRDQIVIFKLLKLFDSKSIECLF